MALAPTTRPPRTSSARETTAPTPGPRRRPGRAALVAIPLALGVLALVTAPWWSSSPASPIERPPLASELPPRTAALPLAPSPATPSTTPPAASPREPIPAEALAAATPALRRCATGAEGEVFLELTVAPGASNFTAIDVVGADPEDARCIRGVLDEIRFSPPGAPDVLLKGIRP